MSTVTFTQDDLRGIQRAVGCILSIVGRRDLDTWAEETMDAVLPLLRGDRSFLAMPEGDELRIFWTEAEMEDALTSYQEEFASYDFLLRERAICRLLHPVFRTAARMSRLLSSGWGRLLQEMDSLSLPLLLLDRDGRVLHRSRAFNRRVAILEVRQRVMEAAVSLVGELTAVEENGSNGAGPIAETAVRVDGGPLGPFELEAVRLAEPAAGDGRFLVHVRALARTLPAPAVLRERFCLTPRESEVALLLVRRLSNREIARELHISENTARHHTEHIFAKLHVNNRTDAARMLLGEG